MNRRRRDDSSIAARLAAADKSRARVSELIAGRSSAMGTREGGRTGARENRGRGAGRRVG